MTYREAAPIIERIRTYFGTNNGALTSYASVMLPDMEMPIKIHISKEEIQDLFARHFKMEPIDEVCDILWLNANAGYDKDYEKTERTYKGQREDVCWESIEMDLLNLYVLLSKYSEEPIEVSMGGDTIKLNNKLDWVMRFFEKFCFPNVLQGITSVEEAQEALAEMTNRVGHPVDRRIENSIVLGVSNIAQDYHLIEGKAPKNLRLFIWEYMCLMKIISPNDLIVNDKWIKSQILQLPKYKSKVVLDSINSNVIDPGDDPCYWPGDKLCYLTDILIDEEPAS